MTGEEGLEWCCRCLEGCYFFGCVASCSRGFVEQSFGGLERTEDLEEGQKVFACTGCKPVEGVANEIGMCMLINEEANSQALWCGAVIYIRNVWNTSADREARYYRG